MRARFAAFTSCLLATALACSSGEATPDHSAASDATQPAAGGLSAFETEHGVGPVTAPVELGAIDGDLAHEGQEVFESKCSACHKMEERYVGPALGDVTVRRTPAFIMNMILNPEGMTARHPDAKKLLGEFMTQMPNLGVTQDEARQVVEYLRTQAPKPAGN